MCEPQGFFQMLLDLAETEHISPSGITGEAMSAIRHALAASPQPAQEPIAYVHRDVLKSLKDGFDGAAYLHVAGTKELFDAPLYAAPTQAAQEPANDAEAWLQTRFGVVRGHPEWRALMEAFNAGRAAPTQAAPAPNEWYEAVDQELIVCESTADSYATPREAVRALIDWHCMVQIDPAVSSAAQELIDRGRKEAAPAVAELVEALKSARELLACMPEPDGYYTKVFSCMREIDAALSRYQEAK